MSGFREVPTIKRVNPRQFDLVTRSCLLNPFLLREIGDFCELEPTQTRNAYNFLASFEKYIISFHVFEYNKVEDKLTGCKALLNLWNTILTKFTFVETTGNQLPLEKKTLDFIVALSNRIDLDIDPVWYRWCKSKKRSRLVRDFRALHERYITLLTHSVRLALTKLLQEGALENGILRRFIARMLSVATLRLPCISARITEAYTGFRSLRLLQMQENLERVQRREGKQSSQEEKNHLTADDVDDTKQDGLGPISEEVEAVETEGVSPVFDESEDHDPVQQHVAPLFPFRDASPAPVISRYTRYAWVGNFLQDLERKMPFQSDVDVDGFDNKTPDTQREFTKRKNKLRGSIRSSIQLPPSSTPSLNAGSMRSSSVTAPLNSGADVKKRTDYRIVMEHPELFGWEMFESAALEASNDDFLGCVPLDDSKCYTVLAHAMSKKDNHNGFYEFYAAYLYHIARRCFSEVWDRVPSFSEFSRSFLTRLVDSRLELIMTAANESVPIMQIVNVEQPKRGGLGWATAALMLNPDPDGWFLGWLCTLMFKTTDVNDRFAMVRTWESVNEWVSTYLTAMRRTNRRPFLPKSLCEQVLLEAISISVKNTHFNVTYCVLSFVYSHWYNIPELELVNILNVLFSPSMFQDLFVHWCHVVRLTYQHIIVYTLGCFRETISLLNTQYGELAAEFNENLRTGEDGDFVVLNRPSNASVASMCCCFKGNSDVSGQDRRKRGLKSKPEVSTTEISLVRISSEPHSDMLSSGYSLIGPLATMIGVYDRDLDPSDDSVVEFYQTEVVDLVEKVSELVRAVKLDLGDYESKYSLNSSMSSYSRHGSRESSRTSHSGHVATLREVKTSVEAGSSPTEEEMLEQAAAQRRRVAYREYDKISQKCARIQAENSTIINPGQLVMPSVVDITQESSQEKIIQKCNQRIKDARRKSFQAILKAEALNEDGEESKSQLPAALFSTQSEIAHARRYRERMRHSSRSPSLNHSNPGSGEDDDDPSDEEGPQRPPNLLALLADTKLIPEDDSETDAAFEESADTKLISGAEDINVDVVEEDDPELPATDDTPVKVGAKGFVALDDDDGPIAAEEDDMEAVSEVDELDGKLTSELTLAELEDEGEFVDEEDDDTVGDLPMSGDYGSGKRLFDRARSSSQVT